MASTAINAQGATLEVETSTPGTADTAIANLKSFSGFDQEASEIDITNLSSTAKEKRAGLQDFGSFQVEFHPDYTDVGQSKMRSLQADGDTAAFMLTLPNGDTVGFDAVVKNAQRMSGGVDAVVEGGAVLAVSGLPVFTAA